MGTRYVFMLLAGIAIGVAIRIPSGVEDNRPPVNSRALVASTTASANSAYYRNCAAARAAGVAPIYRGQPGYRPPLDRDDDGVACEPYYGPD